MSEMNLKNTKIDVTNINNIDFCEFTYGYEIGLCLLSNIKVNFLKDVLADGTPVKEFIEKKIAEYTAISVLSTTNAKAIDKSKLIIGENTIEFMLYSMKDVEGIGRSLRKLSQLLIEEDYFANLRVGNKLFKSFIPSESMENDGQEKVYLSDIPDEKLVKALIDVLVTPEKELKGDKRNALTKMKFIAYEAGILQL